MDNKHDNLRDRIGQALFDAIQSGAENPDWFDAREIDRLADAVMGVLGARGRVPDIYIDPVADKLKACSHNGSHYLVPYGVMKDALHVFDRARRHPHTTLSMTRSIAPDKFWHWAVIMPDGHLYDFRGGYDNWHSCFLELQTKGVPSLLEADRRWRLDHFDGEEHERTETAAD